MGKRKSGGEGKEGNAALLTRTDEQPVRTGAPAPPAAELSRPCFVVGIGASAGGEFPLENLLSTIPTDCNLSFVVVTHIPPQGPPLLAELLGRYTPMPVITAENGTPPKPNTVQVIPPGWDLLLRDGRLVLEAPAGAGAAHLPIDRFFSSLAEEMGERAIAVVLSGYGKDGTEGVKRIREKGGVVLVQEPENARQPFMPQSAIATGAADMVLPAFQIAERLVEIAAIACRLPGNACRTASFDDELKAILTVVKTRTGHDFSSYKRNTVMRRVERRMMVNGAGGLKKYLAYLEREPEEAQALCQELLIGVTGFFRDPEAFERLGQEVIPALFAGRHGDEPVRIWHACCSTGEEAYSVAILIQEFLDKSEQSIRVQLFATDINESAVAGARSGLYSDDIAQEVGEARLKVFFTRHEGRWQVAKRLREMIVFASHSIIKDPPFSRLDLLVCRNFLIYLDPDMQKRLIALFHMVLKPGGFLFLGASETVGGEADLFAPVDKKWKIYRRLGGERRPDTLFPFTAPVRRPQRAAPTRQQPAEAGETTPGAFAESLLIQRYSPPCVVVNEEYEVVYFSTRTKRYLDALVGEPTLDILRMAREELRPALRAAIYKAFTERKKVTFQGIKVTDETGEDTVNLMAEPFTLSPGGARMALVILEPAPIPAQFPPPNEGEGLGGDQAMLVRQLEEQLRITHEQLQATMEQLETSNEGFMSANEELMSINEEFQSTNEELQSTNEELETSKEELQALNEELTTVNSELQAKLQELNQANSDMENLIANSEIATVFLDLKLNINRFTPAMAAILHLIPTDAGRPFRQVSGNIDWTGLPGDAATVLEKLVPVEREVTARESGNCYIMRVLPYRAAAGKIDGVVITLTDITERKRAEEQIRRQMEELRQSNEELRRFNRSAVDRELRMIELKREVNDICRKFGEPERYDLEFMKKS